MSTVESGTAGSNPDGKNVLTPSVPPSQVKETIEGRLLAALGLVLAVSLIVLAAAVRNTFQAIDSSDWVNHTHAVILEVDAIFSSLNASEASARHYLITGNDRDHAACQTAMGDVSEHLEVAKTLIGNDAQHKQQLGRLEPLVTHRLELIANIIQTRKAKGFEAASQLLQAPDASPVLRGIRDIITALEVEENVLLHSQDQKSRHDALETRLILFSGVGLNFVLLGICFWLVRMDLAVRRAYAAFLENSNDILEQKVKERTAELAKANESLTIENLERQWSQAALERLCRHNEMVIQSLGEGVCVISQLGNVIQLNPTAAFSAGYKSTQELVGQPLRKFLRQSAQSAETVWKDTPIAQAMKDGRALDHLQGALLRKEGGESPIRFTCRPLMDNGKVVGAVVAIVELGEKN